MAVEVKKFLDSAGTTHLWEKIVTELNKKANTSSLAAVATSGAAVDVAVADAGKYFTGSTVEAVLQELGNNMQTAGAVTITPADGAEGSEVLKSYTFSQNGSTIGTINIPRDLVATAGEIVAADGSGTAGTFLKLTIANSDPIYINVADLVEYNGVADSDEIAFTDANHQISGTIKTGSIAKGKLATAVQDSLDKADSALQAADIIEGTVDGAISVKGNSVAVHGLGSAAYTESSAYATAAQGTKADSALQAADVVALTNAEIDAAIAAASNS